MESPPILFTRISDNQRRMSSTSQMFTRLNKSPTTRELKTSKLPRAFPHSTSKQSLQNFKQNMNYETYLQKIKQALKTDQKSLASNYLLSLRKQYDKMSKNIKEHSSSINIMKKEIQFMKNKIRNQSDYLVTSQDRLEFLRTELEDIQSKQQQGKMQTKMLQHIITRMKQDQLQRKSLCQFKQLQTKQVKKQLKLKQDEILQWDESIHKMFEQMSKLKVEFKKNCQERELKLQDYKLHMGDLEEQEKFEKERRERTFELLSMESNDIMDAKNIVLRDVLMTNKVLDKLLEGKINDLLNHYQELQNSYHLIKTETNLADPQLLAKKFFSYSQNLQQITSAITYYEQKQQLLSLRNKQLKQIETQKLIKKLEQDKLLTDIQNETQQQKQKLINECREKELTVKRIKMWLDKMCQTVGCRRLGELGVDKQVGEICEVVLKKAKQVQEDPEQINHKFQSPGIRLKKILMKQFTTQDEKRRSEAQQVNQSNIFENIYLNYQRKQVKKNQFQIKMQVKPVKQ